MGHDVEHGVEALDRALRRARRVEDQRAAPGAGHARDRRPSGLTSRMASARPGRLAVEDDPGALGREVARAEPGAAGGDDQPGEALGQLDQRLADASRGRRRRPGASTTSKPSARQPLDQRRRPPRSSRVPATTPSDTVSTLACRPVGVVVGASAVRG